MALRTNRDDYAHRILKKKKIAAELRDNNPVAPTIADVYYYQRIVPLYLPDHFINSATMKRDVEIIQEPFFQFIVKELLF